MCILATLADNDKKCGIYMCTVLSVARLNIVDNHKHISYIDALYYFKEFRGRRELSEITW